MNVGFYLPITVDGLKSEDILAATKSDKKMEQGTIKFILLESVGHAVVDRTVTDEEMLEAINSINGDLIDESKKLSPLAVYLVCAAAIVLLLAADQYTKSLAVQYLKDQPSIELIPGVFGAVLSGKRGMAFGLLQDQYWLFAMMTVIVSDRHGDCLLQASKDTPLFTAFLPC